MSKVLYFSVPWSEPEVIRGFETKPTSDVSITLFILSRHASEDIVTNIGGTADCCAVLDVGQSRQKRR